ncbi:MAG: hypothetical protein LUG46_01895 [Erysipelotrichaceae bacterium]|nr:hypothetical protein [Erysipelotrichaceae bacterium]
MQNIAIAIRVNKDYPNALDKPDEKLPREEKYKIFKDVRALMISKISFVTLNSTDNIIISAFIGVTSVGLLSNFTIITDAITAIISQITNSITASLGNYFAVEDKKSGYKLFCRVDFLSFWLYGFSMIALSALLVPFVTLWLGSEYSLTETIAIVLSIRFFVEGYMRTMSIFRSTLGLFVYGQLLPLVATAINIVLSVVLSFVWGMAGVLIATPIARLCTQAWYIPWLVHNKGFQRSAIPYALKYFLRIVLLTITTVITLLVVQNILAFGVTIFSFTIAVIFTGIFPNLVFLIAFFWTDDFKYFLNLLLGMVNLKK